MNAVRRRLRFAAVVWLCAQTASLAAFVPADCCARHVPAPMEAGASCHRQPQSHEGHGQECPMPGPDGTPCPMHRASSRESSASSRPECTMTAACDGPAAALLSVLTYHGVLPALSAIQPDPFSASALPLPAARVAPHVSIPDSPPPRL